jgi:hypothetical protein
LKIIKIGFTLFDDFTVLRTKVSIVGLIEYELVIIEIFLNQNWPRNYFTIEPKIVIMMINYVNATKPYKIEMLEKQILSFEVPF